MNDQDHLDYLTFEIEVSAVNYIRASKSKGMDNDEIISFLELFLETMVEC